MISCILLAAGESRRFGSPKALAPLGKGTVIESTQSKLLKSIVTETIIVLGSSAQDIIPEILPNSAIRYVINNNISLGVTSSLKLGLDLIGPKTQGIMVLPIDLPLIKIQTFNELINSFFQKASLIQIPTFEGKPGQPIIFSTRLLQELKNIPNELEFSNLQFQYPDHLLKIPVQDPGVILEFNTREDYLKIVKPSKY